MSTNKNDFLNILENKIDNRVELANYLENDFDISSLSKDLQVVGSMSEHEIEETFIESLQHKFTVVDRNDKIALIESNDGEISYYVLIDDLEFPLFLTTATKTEEIPETVGEFLRKEPKVSRFWIGKMQMDRLRKHIEKNTDGIILSYFTTKRSRHSDLPAKRRENYKRTMPYWGDDGMEVIKEFKEDYGVLPTNMKFENPGEFKFQVTQKGVFTAIDGGIREVLKMIDHSMDHYRNIKDSASTMEFGSDEYTLSGEVTHSKPWVIELSGRPDSNDIKHFEEFINQEEIEFRVVDFEMDLEAQSFTVELMDTDNYSKTVLRTKEDSIWIHPREDTGLDQSIRIFNLVDDNIDSNCEAATVA